MKKKSNEEDLKPVNLPPKPGDPDYVASDDIYARQKKEPLDPEDLAREEQMKNDPSLDDDLDIPGAELDDQDEQIGEEDEENNYYSLGGDNHSNLDEN
jgi:hypothetical protein